MEEGYSIATGLGQFSLIGNPLFIPRLTVEVPLDKFEHNPSPSDDYFLEFRRASGGLWLSYQPTAHGLTSEIYLSQDSDYGIKEGSLAKTHILHVQKIFGMMSCQFDHEKTTLNNLLEEGFLNEITYQEAFYNLGILPFYEDRLTEISDKQKVVFQIPEGQTGKVAIKKYYSGKKPREKNSILDSIKDKIEWLFPEPQKQPVCTYNFKG